MSGEKSSGKYEDLSFDEILTGLAEKWREVPGGSDDTERQFSDSLLQMSDEAFLLFWEKQAQAGYELRSWWWNIYSDLLRSKKVLEVGSGMGFDAVTFALNGAHVTCCDVAPTNLQVVSRIARLKNLDIKTLPIESIRSFDSLPDDFEIFWACGSLINLPFKAAREECAAILKHLKSDARWIELAYPRERWTRDNSPSFAMWGKMTDGERTPWIEWYDMERLKQRLYPHKFERLLEYHYCSEAYIWLDARRVGMCDEQFSITVAPPAESIETPPNLWNFAWSTPLPKQEKSNVTLEIRCTIENGAVGFVIEKDGKFISREVTVDAGASDKLVYLATDQFGDGSFLSTRNACGFGKSKFSIESLTLRNRL